MALPSHMLNIIEPSDRDSNFGWWDTGNFPAVINLPILLQQFVSKKFIIAVHVIFNSDIFKTKGEWYVEKDKLNSVVIASYS